MDGFVLPDYNNSLCNLVNEEKKIFGIETDGKTFNLGLRNNRKTSLIFMDGMGWNLFLETTNFKKLTSKKISSVFPSSTDTASVSIVTGLNPGMHGILGYKSFFKLAGAIVKPLEYTFASALHSNNLLNKIGNLNEMFKVNTIFDALSKKGIRSLVITPDFTVNSSFSSLIFSGASEISGYDNIWEAFYIYRKALENDSIKFIHFYIPYLDTIEHEYGFKNQEAIEAADYILSKISSLNAYKKTNTMITADHGHTPIDKMIDLSRDKRLIKKLELPPYGDSRSPLFRTRYDITGDLEKYEMKIFDKRSNELLLGRIGKNVEDLMPDFIGAAEENFGFTFNYKLKKKAEDAKFERPSSSHGGLSKDEMEIPLITL